MSQTLKLNNGREIPTIGLGTYKVIIHKLILK